MLFFGRIIRLLDFNHWLIWRLWCIESSAFVFGIAVSCSSYLSNFLELQRLNLNWGVNFLLNWLLMLNWIRILFIQFSFAQTGIFIPALKLLSIVVQLSTVVIQLLRTSLEHAFRILKLVRCSSHEIGHCLNVCMVWIKCSVVDVRRFLTHFFIW